MAKRKHPLVELLEGIGQEQGSCPNIDNKRSEFLSCGGGELVDQAEAHRRINVFLEDMQALRLKHRIPTVLVGASVETKVEGNDEAWGASALPVFFGDKSEAVNMARMVIARYGVEND